MPQRWAIILVKDIGTKEELGEGLALVENALEVADEKVK